ncbi:MAG: hypothetical protein QXJ97_04415 [Desulfurococcaceae archaeon]
MNRAYVKRLVSDIEGSLSKPFSATRRDPTRAWVRPRGIPSFRHYVLTRGEVLLEKRSGLYEAPIMRTLNELAILKSEETIL